MLNLSNVKIIFGVTGAVKCRNKNLKNIQQTSGGLRFYYLKQICSLKNISFIKISNCLLGERSQVYNV